MIERQIPRGPGNLICPLHRKAMARVCHTCPWWVQVHGKNPQSHEHIDRWECAISWLPLLLVENSQMQRQTGAAVESCRNEMVNQNGLAISAILGAVPQIPRHGQPHALPLIEGKD